MLKNKYATECSREKYIESGKKLAEEKKQRAMLRKATKPNCKSNWH